MGSENLARLGAPHFVLFITLPIPYLKNLLSVLIPVASVLALFAGANGMINGNATILHAMEKKNYSHFGQRVGVNRLIDHG